MLNGRFSFKLHPGMKFYSFHPGMKFTCKQKFFHPGTSFIPGWDFISVTCRRTLSGSRLNWKLDPKRVFTGEISSRNETRPWTKSSLSTVKNLLLFTRFCRGEFSSRDEKKKKRRVTTSSRDEIWCMYLNMLSKVSVFEPNESTNVMKHKAPL